MMAAAIFNGIQKLFLFNEVNLQNNLEFLFQLLTQYEYTL